MLNRGGLISTYEEWKDAKDNATQNLTVDQF